MFRISKFFLYIIPLNVAIVTSSTLFPFIVGKYVWFRTSVDLALIFFLLGLAFASDARLYLNRLRKLLRSPLAIAITVFTAVFLLAGFTGIHPSLSFWSNFERGEGGLQILHLWLFFLLLVTLFREKKEWRRMFVISVIAALLMIGYGMGAGLKYVDAEFITRDVGEYEARELTGKGGPLYQTFKRFIGPSFTSQAEDYQYRFQGSIGNSSYVAAYLVFAFFYAFYLLLGARGKFLKSAPSIIFFVLAVLFAVFFVLAATRGTFIGAGAAVIGFLAYFGFSNKKWRLKAAIISLVLIVSFVSLVKFHETPFVQSLPASRIFDLSLNTQTLGHRMIMWNIAWDGWKDRPILGFGPENYIFVFDGYFDTRYFDPAVGFGAWFDRAHSVIFDSLVETGTLGFLSYFAVFIVFYVQFFLFRKRQRLAAPIPAEKDTKASNNYRPMAEDALIFVLPIAYLVQGLVLFDVLTIYINLFLFLAFAAYKFSFSEFTRKA